MEGVAKRFGGVVEKLKGNHFCQRKDKLFVEWSFMCFVNSNVDMAKFWSRKTTTIMQVLIVFQRH